jgi:chemotaxis protein methyltransferase CheR
MQEIQIVDIRKLTETIRDRYGYDFSNYAMSSFKRRIQRILELYRFSNLTALIEKIASEEAFFKDFLSEITVNVTEMFRDPSFWRELRDNVIPNILLNHERVSVWHAGCSSGEEVYSMAILLKEMGILDNARIVATDIDEVILDKAKSGVFSKKNVDLNEKNYIRFRGDRQFGDYYQLHNDQVIVDRDLIRNVSFRKHDLVNGVVFSKFDLILCRNVMIYFNQTLQNAVLKKLHESNFKYGYLAIGSKESLIWCEIANKFIVVNNEEKIYKKIKE